MHLIITVFLYTAYRHLLRAAPTVGKSVKVCNEETELVLQDCYESTNLDVFRTAAIRKDSTVDLEDYANGL